MIRASDLPEFLWEPAVAHAAYIRNHAYTSAIKDQTPYQGWYGKKPNVTHLREFGAPVWILLQGQTKAQKIMPKSQRHAYIRNKDVSKSVIYYNAQTKKILSSRNYVFLNIKQPEPPEDIIISNTPLREGECEGKDAQEGDPEPHPPEPSTSQQRQPSLEPRKTRGVRWDYNQLNDPYTSEEDLAIDEPEESLIQEVLSAEIGDEFHSLKEARNFPDWPDWEKVIQSKLQQHQEKGTWELVDKPRDTVPLSNKWVFVTKRDNEGMIVKLKARLVVKGCGQRKGFDFLEMHSPVVHVESICAILAIAITKRLLIQQMDVKGVMIRSLHICHDTT